MKKPDALRKIIISAMMLALCFVLPFLSGTVPKIGNMLCLMHIPVLLTGFICGAPYGAAVGFTAPLLRSFTVGMPPFFPKGISMAFELCAYGFFAGIFYKVLPPKKISIYISLVLSMLIGRAVWGTARFICTGLDTHTFGISAFIAGGFTTALPGIVLQVILIPLIVMAYEKAGINNSD